MSCMAGVMHSVRPPSDVTKYFVVDVVVVVVIVVLVVVVTDIKVGFLQ